MAKLEEQVSANELVQIIRTGKTKGEIVKEYRTSDQELAMMLLPLYRAGQLTKEEFNDFFKGLSLKREEEPEEDVTEATPPPEEVAEAPADTRTRLARVFSRKAKAQEEEEPPEEVAAQEPPEPVEEIPEEPIEELTEEDILRGGRSPGRDRGAGCGARRRRAGVRRNRNRRNRRNRRSRRNGNRSGTGNRTGRSDCRAGGSRCPRAGTNGRALPRRRWMRRSARFWPGWSQFEKRLIRIEKNLPVRR